MKNVNDCSDCEYGRDKLCLRCLISQSFQDWPEWRRIKPKGKTLDSILGLDGRY